MLALVLDTSAAASAALISDTAPDAHGVGGSVLSEWSTEDTRSHAEVLTPAVLRVLEQAGMTGAQLDAVIVGTGPGPFTGLRAGLVTARALGFGWGVPVLGLPSHHALAHRLAERARAAGVDPPERAVLATDARRGELYWAAADFTGAVPQLVDGPHVSRAEQVPDLPALGLGAGLYRERLAQVLSEPALGEEPLTWQPAARDLGRAALARRAAGHELSADTSALYLRESDAKVPAQRKRATA